jgi:hypothetical protein
MKMFKKTLVLTTFLFATTTVLAQSPFFQSGQKSTSRPEAQLPPISPNSMSPQDFSQKIETINTQNQTAFKQQLNQKLSQVSPPKMDDASSTNTPPVAAAAPTPTAPNATAKPTTAAPPSKTAPSYTGFQSSQPNNTTAPANNSGGWNVKY